MRKFVAASLVAAFTGIAFGAVGATVSQTTPTATGGADFNASFNATHFSFDVQMTTTLDWTASEVRVNVSRPDIATIWHASDQLSYVSDPNDPQFSNPLNNLATNGAPATNTRSYDTMLRMPSTAGTMTLGNYATGGVSNSTDIHGVNPIGDPIALAWFNTGNTDTNSNFRGVRVTLESAIPLNMLGGIPVATIVGQAREAQGGFANFSATIYAIPEPATIALLGLGGLATLLRRR